MNSIKAFVFIRKIYNFFFFKEAPGRPSRPEIEMSADTEVFMRWDPPERIPTNLDGVVYRVECRPAGENDVINCF